MASDPTPATRDSLLHDLDTIAHHAAAQLATLNTRAELEEWRIRILGRKGELTTVLRRLGGLPAEDRPAVGERANLHKGELERQLDARLAQAARAELEQRLRDERLDVTLPGRPIPQGSIHPVNRTLAEMRDIFGRMGFQVVEGPEVEWEDFNFQMLNIPADHPARDLWDTFWIDDTMLLRTHTSPTQIRVMTSQQPPVRVIMPGRCYRYEATSATNESIFYQIEGLMIDEHCTMADLKGVLINFAREMYGHERQARFRTTYYPFTEPSAAMDIDCMVCQGAGCRSCKYTGWVTILGSGMVHPQVLRNVGYDPDKVSGFAFGMGVERITALKYNIDDIRYFYANDVRFLEQFD